MLRVRPTLLALFLVLGAAACTPALVRAFPPEEPGEKAGKKEEEARKGLEPRFDLTIWTIVVFGLLYLVLRYVKLPGASAPAFVMMLDGLQRREQAIHTALDEAKRAQEESQKLREQFQQDMKKAQEDARAVLEQARRDADRSREEMLARARADIQAERDRLRREMDNARDQALQELLNQAANLATLVASKAIRRELTLDDHRRLVDEALSEMREAETYARH
jgi:F-type H+-transporting ATPase subunit b